MPQWLWPTYAGFIILLGAAGALVALLVPEEDQDRRRVAYGIVKLALGASTGITGLATAVVRLSEAGLL